MTIDELLAREAIRKTMAKYNMSGDRLRVDEFLSCFTDDAIMESEFVAPDKTFRYEGKAAITAWQNRWRDRDPDQGKVHEARFIRHHLATSQIELTGTDTAKTRTYFLCVTDVGPDHAGIYVDDYRKVGEEWLIAHRRVRLDWESPDSLYKSAAANTNA